MHPESVVVDASFVVRLVMAGDPAVEPLVTWKRFLSKGIHVAAPALLFYEVGNALFKYLRHGMKTEDIMFALDVALGLGIEPVEDRSLHSEAVSIALVLGLPSAYDSHYLAVARRLGCDLWTYDRKLVERASPRFPWVRLGR